MDVRQAALSQLVSAERSGMATHVAWLARHFGRRELAPFSREDVAVLSRVVGRVGLLPGQRLLTAGEPARAAYVVERGEIALYLNRHGRRRLIGVQRPGGVVGDIPLLCDAPVPYTALARSEATLLKVDRDALLELLTTHSAIALRWLTNTVRRLDQANRRLAVLTTGDLRERVLGLLADELRTSDSRRRIELTQSEMASLLGGTRQSVNRVLSDLADEGLLHTAYGGVEVRDPSRLLELAGQSGRVGAAC